MGRTEKSSDAGKARKNHITPDPVPVAKKSFKRPEETERPIANIDFTKNTWSVKEAALWAGVPERTLYRMLREGLVPCIALGESQTQKLPSAKSGKRERRCSRFIIPRVAFVKAWESLGSAGNLGNTAA